MTMPESSPGINAYELERQALIAEIKRVVAAKRHAKVLAKSKRIDFMAQPYWGELERLEQKHMNLAVRLARLMWVTA